MKLNEAINIPLHENARDQSALEQVAKAIMYHMDRHPDNEKPIFHFPLSDIRGLSHLYPRLRSIELVVWNSTATTTHGVFSRGLKEIRINTGGRTKDQIESTLIHELRHALDSSYSKGKYMDKSQDYMKSQHEINARFSETMRELNLAFHQSIRSGEPMSVTEYMSEFERLAIKHQLVSVFADPSQSEAAEWLSRMGDDGKIDVYGIRTDALTIIQHFTGQSRLSSAITDKKRWNRLLVRVYKSYEYQMERFYK